MIRYFLPILMAFPFSSGDLFAQTVTGRVLDAATHAGVAGVQVTLIRPNGNPIGEAVSDAEGRFALRAKNAGMHRLRAQHIAYRAVTTDSFDIGSRQQVIVDIVLATAAVPLAPLTIVARRRDLRHDATEDGLYARRQTIAHIGTARVFLPHDPEMAASLDARDVLSWYPRHRGCRFVFWNGNFVPVDSEPLLRLPVSQLEAVEFYKNDIDAPAGFRQQVAGITGFCEIVALWPRTGRFQTVPPAPDLPPYNGYASLGPAFTHVSGPQSPGAGAGLEATAHLPMRGTFGIGLNLRLTYHRLPAATTDALTRGFGQTLYVLPPGARTLRLLVAGIEPRIAVLAGRSTRLTVGVRLQVAQRAFSVEQPAVHSKPAGMKSLAAGGGPALALETQLNERIAINATFNYDHLPFGEYRNLQRAGTRTSATWGVSTLRIGLLFNPPW